MNKQGIYSNEEGSNETETLLSNTTGRMSLNAHTDFQHLRSLIRPLRFDKEIGLQSEYFDPHL